MKIEKLKDIVEVSNKIIENLVTKQKLTQFVLAVDHGDGTISNCAFTPTSQISPQQRFIAVGDYKTLLLLLFRHPKLQHLEYDEDKHMVSAAFWAGEDMQELESIENPENPEGEF